MLDAHSLGWDCLHAQQPLLWLCSLQETAPSTPSLFPRDLVWNLSLLSHVLFWGLESPVLWIKRYLLLGSAWHGPLHPKGHIHCFLHSRLLLTQPRCQCWNTKCSRTSPTFQVLCEAHWGWTEEPFLPRSSIHQGLSETPAPCCTCISTLC